MRLVSAPLIDHQRPLQPASGSSEISSEPGQSTHFLRPRCPCRSESQPASCVILAPLQSQRQGRSVISRSSSSSSVASSSLRLVKIAPMPSPRFLSTSVSVRPSVSAQTNPACRNGSTPSRSVTRAETPRVTRPAAHRPGGQLAWPGGFRRACLPPGAPVRSCSVCASGAGAFRLAAFQPECVPSCRRAKSRIGLLHRRIALRPAAALGAFLPHIARHLPAFCAAGVPSRVLKTGKTCR